jgi:hypothetical protein
MNAATKDFPLPNWQSSLLPFILGGAGIMGLLGYAGLFQKDKEMTKLEKACVALLVALGEKVEELEKRNADLAEKLAAGPSKAEFERMERRAAEQDAKLAEAVERAERAEAALAAVQTPAPAAKTKTAKSK